MAFWFGMREGVEKSEGLRECVWKGRRGGVHDL